MKKYKNITIDIYKGIAIIWLNRPEVHNALNENMLNELILCFKELNSLPDVRVILLRGHGKSFCSGADISFMRNKADGDQSDNIKHCTLLAKCFSTVYSSEKPVIAIAHGTVMAGGIGLIAACDLVVASEMTSFSIPETRLGLIPSVILPYILTRLSLQKAKMLIYTGIKINSSEAFKAGLVDFVVKEEEIELKINELLENIFKSSPNALKEIKMLIHKCHGKPVSESIINKTMRVLAQVKVSDDAKEGMDAFIEKRHPAWIEKTE